MADINSKGRAGIATETDALRGSVVEGSHPGRSRARRPRRARLSRRRLAGEGGAVDCTGRRMTAPLPDG